MLLHANWRPVALALVLILAIMVVFCLTAQPLLAQEPLPPATATLPAASLKSGQLATEWQPAGAGGPYERVVYALALGPSPEVLYAGTWGNGLYRSNDGGLSWHATSPPGKQAGLAPPAEAAVRALAVTPDGQTVYLSRWGTGVWRSVDQGLTWESVSRPDCNVPGWMPVSEKDLSFLLSTPWQNVEVVALDSKNPQILYQGAWDGFYKSVNRGDWWEYVDVAPDIARKNKKIYALTQAEDGALYIGTFGAGVYRSQDGGQTWQALGPQAPDLARNIYALAMRNGVVWAGSEDGVYRRIGDELQWQQVITGFADGPDARRVQAIEMDEDGNLYAGTIDFGVYRSADGGESWQPYNDGLRGYALAILSLVYDDRVDTLYAATYGAGVYRNTGHGWEAINGIGDNAIPLSVFEVQSLAFAGPHRETLLVGTLVGGVYASNDRGQSWRRKSYALPIGTARNVADIVTLNEGQTVVVAGGTGLRYSTNGGVDWEWAKGDWPEGDYPVLSLVQSKRHPELLLAALREENAVGVYRSSDGGQRWERGGQLASIDDLALSGDGQTLFATQLGQGLFRSDDQGATWEPLGVGIIPHSHQIVVSERNIGQQLILGGKRRSLHVLALDGIYSSLDEGNTWQSPLRGQFETLLADPTYPGVLYATAMTAAVPAKVTISQTTLSQNVATKTVTLSDKPQYAFWISLDDGQSWRQAGLSRRPLTVLALDPLDHNCILAGTSDDGVYSTRLNLPSPYSSGRALAGLAAFVVLPTLVAGALLGLYLYFLLGLQLQLYPWQVWGLLFYTSAWRLVSTPRSALGALEQLVASVAADFEAPFCLDELWNKLQTLGVAPSLPQVQNALSDLQARRLFTRDTQSNYRFSLIALARLAALNFEREALIEEVRGANRIIHATEAFFDQAGFQVVSLLDRLSLWPDTPYYRSLNWLNVWLHGHQALDEADVARLMDNIGAGSRDLGFVVLDHIPSPAAYRAMYAARLIPLSSSEIQRALDQREAGLALERAIREGQGQEDVFDLRQPLLDHLAFFGRSQALKAWLSDVEQDRDSYFWGLPRSGRTSALWWLWTRVPGRWLRGYIDLRFRGLDWTPILKDMLTDLLTDLRRTYSRLPSLPELDDVLAACGGGQDLGAGLNYLVDRGLRSPRFVFFLDGARPSAVLDRFQNLAQARKDVSLLVSWDELPANPSAINGHEWLPLLSPAESHVLLKTIGARLGLEFADSDLDVLDHAAGGHPFLLRQLGSQAARLAGRPDKASAGQVFAPGKWPAPLTLTHIPAETVVQAYLQQQPDSLRQLWQALPAEVRRNCRLLAAGRTLDPELESDYAVLGLLAPSGNGNGASRLRIGLLSRWLQEDRL